MTAEVEPNLAGWKDADDGAALVLPIAVLFGFGDFVIFGFGFGGFENFLETTGVNCPVELPGTVCLVILGPFGLFFAADADVNEVCGFDCVAEGDIKCLFVMEGVTNFVPEAAGFLLYKDVVFKSDDAEEDFVNGFILFLVFDPVAFEVEGDDNCFTDPVGGVAIGFSCFFFTFAVDCGRMAPGVVMDFAFKFLL